MEVSWPGDHKFCFTIFDDSDWVSINKVKPVYELLYDLGMQTTKSVWVFDGKDKACRNGGVTLENKEYLEWVNLLKMKGFEIGLHNSSPATSTRETTAKALARIKAIFGYQSICNANHVGCLDAIYWGDARFSGLNQKIYNILTRGQNEKISRGHVEGDPVFWGDLCQQYVSYVRNFVFPGLDTLAICPEMPYHDAAKPFVNYWFASADGGNLEIFLRNFTIEKIDHLVDDGGACIAYVHFAAGFASDGKVDPEFRKRMEYIASHGGWFVPVSKVLDHLRGGGDLVSRTISPERLAKLETQWLASKLLTKAQKRLQS